MTTDPILHDMSCVIFLNSFLCNLFLHSPYICCNNCLLSDSQDMLRGRISGKFVAYDLFGRFWFLNVGNHALPGKKIKCVAVCGCTLGRGCHLWGGSGGQVHVRSQDQVLRQWAQRFVLAVACGDCDACRVVDVGFSSRSGMGRRPLSGNSWGFNQWSGTAGAFVMRRGSCSAFERNFETLDEIETASFKWRSTLHSVR